MLCVLQFETNELVDFSTCELVSRSTGRLLNNVWSGPKHVVTHEYVSKTNLRGSCGRYPYHKCPEFLLQVEDAHLVAFERASVRQRPNLRLSWVAAVWAWVRGRGGGTRSTAVARAEHFKMNSFEYQLQLHSRPFSKFSTTLSAISLSDGFWMPRSRAPHWLPQQDLLLDQ